MEKTNRVAPPPTLKILPLNAKDLYEIVLITDDKAGELKWLIPISENGVRDPVRAQKFKGFSRIQNSGRSAEPRILDRSRNTFPSSRSLAPPPRGGDPRSPETDRGGGRADPPRRGQTVLTPFEIELIPYIQKDLRPCEIARLLSLSESKVNSARARLAAKFGLFSARYLSSYLLTQREPHEDPLHPDRPNRDTL